MAISCTPIRSASSLTRAATVSGVPTNDSRRSCSILAPFLGAKRLGCRGLGRVHRQEDASIAGQLPDRPRRIVMLCLFVGVRGEAPDAEPGERLGKTLARLIIPEIEVDGALPPAPVGEEPGKAVRQSEMRGELGAVIGTAENPDLRNRVGLWIRLEPFRKDDSRAKAPHRPRPSDRGHRRESVRPAHGPSG